ncbi:MAG: alpha/beta fold hydrolase [Variovorax sp.]
MNTDPLLLVPGLMCDRAAWDPLIPVLGRQVTCVVVDHSDADSLALMARRLLDTAPPRFALAGHSMGGRVALEVMRQAPLRVSRLALLDTGYRGRAAGAAGETEAAQRARLLEIARSQGVRAMASTWVQGMVHPSRLADAALIESIIDMFERKTADIFAAQIAALLGRADAADLLTGIAVPTLVLCGRQDGWAPVAQHQEIADRIPGAVLDVVDDAGHMSTMERPVTVAAALRRWLDIEEKQNGTADFAASPGAFN